jgi:hypothetical protein
VAIEAVTEPGGVIPFSAHYLMGEIASVLSILGYFAQILPAIATLMAICWYAILIVESHTIQRVLKARRLVLSDAVDAREKVLDRAERTAEGLKRK